ncbi:hypothetical protein CPB84DRAFT_1683820, partial [Gymnopilus junonius]
PRQPHTHTSAAVIWAFKSLSLKFKLKKCKEIEEQNDECNMRTLQHEADPVSHPEASSETASMFTIDDEDLEHLKHPSFTSLFKDVMLTYLANFLTDCDLADSVENKHEVNSIADQHVAKCCCMDGALLKPQTIDTPLEIQYTQLLYETEDCVWSCFPSFLTQVSFISLSMVLMFQSLK